MRFVNLFIRQALSRVSVAALLLGVSAGGRTFASDGEKYLAAAGPTPIRILMEAPRLDPTKALPRLRMSDAVKPVKAALAAQPNAREAIVNRLETAEPATGSGELISMQALPTTTNNETPKQEPTTQVSPQMLLRYFSRGGTNEVLVPYTVDFTPPVPRKGGDSKAVYIVE